MEQIKNQILDKTSLIFLFIFLFAFSITANSQKTTYDDSWGKAGFTLTSEKNTGVQINYSINEFSFNDIIIDKENMKNIILPGHFLPNDEGAPNLPGSGRYIAIPQGAIASVEIISSRTQIFKNVNIAPAPRIPLDTETGPLDYKKDNKVYSKNALYPAKAVSLSTPTQIRGVDVVMLGITPFQYNPVSKELIVYRDLKVKVSFESGNNYFGEDRLRSRWWDPILNDAVLNHNSLPKIDYNTHSSNSREEGCEYLIVTPDNPEFQQWADSLRVFRTRQGISTNIVTLSEIGGNSVTILENYFNNAYNTWDIPPVAVLILGDYGTNINNRILSPVWDNYCVSDNIYADVTNDDMPDMVFSRITARNAAELEIMVSKVINYERNPPVNPDFYDHPITALGWQTERWFQICSESIGGFWKNELGKDPVRINEVYDGDPTVDPWSTAPNTATVVNYFGPNGLGYIPASPSELSGWTGGNATMVTNAINSGAFMLQHRDHGGETGWGEPNYDNNDIDDLTNTDLSFIMSINCLTGKYNSGNEVFAEKFHRYAYNGNNSGALGVIAASHISYSFVNDTYVWGFYDNLWPEFMPDYGTTPDSRGLVPSFGNAAAKYFLRQSNWPYNTGNKEVTYNLFHHHGGSFSVMYSEIPQDLTVVHDPVILGGIDNFTVTADDGAFIALTVNNEIIGTADATGSPVNISIDSQTPGDTMIVTITKTNHYRYSAFVPVIPPDGAYCVIDSHTFTDDNGNGILEYAESALFTLFVENLGNDDASNVEITLSTQDEYITITDSTEGYGTILAQEIVSVDDGFAIEAANDIPDQHIVIFNVSATDGTDIWESSFIDTFHAPVLELITFEISDPSGNNNGRIDPGETVDIIITVGNSGTAEAFNVLGELICEDEYITINTNNMTYGNIAGSGYNVQSFNVTADDDTPGGFLAHFDLNISADENITASGSFETIIGQFAALVLDLDPGSHSGPAIAEEIENLGFYTDYTTEFPQDDLAIYQSVFLSLGIFFSHHELTTAEGQLLADYLEDGGNLYMEGRETFDVDPQTAVHGMFNVSAVHGTWFQFMNIYGEPDTFTEGMSFEYDGVNPYNNNYLTAEEPAFVILRSEEEDYGCGVAFDGGNYRTIAATHEFGALVDGDYPSTKMELMLNYLHFFGIESPYVGVNEINNKNIEIRNYPNPFSNHTTIEFYLNKNSKVTLEIFNMNGQKIKTLINKNLNAGKHNFDWNCNNDKNSKLPSGIYFYKIQAGNNQSINKLIVI
ncbi:MAG: T9SS type A sorting domain-containing protein [Bacteroidales bacterium]|nr:T9SS type A sorting domain-containing protein [Bacteroidales bacterium]